MDVQIPELVDVRLEGGPSHMPDEMRRRQASTADYKIKIEYYGGYEHFERVASDEVTGAPVVYRWIGSSRIAE